MLGSAIVDIHICTMHMHIHIYTHTYIYTMHSVSSLIYLMRVLDPAVSSVLSLSFSRVLGCSTSNLLSLSLSLSPLMLSLTLLYCSLSLSLLYCSPISLLNNSSLCLLLANEPIGLNQQAFLKNTTKPLTAAKFVPEKKKQKYTS